MNIDSPQPTSPPPPPSAPPPTLIPELKGEVEKETKKQTETFNNSYTPVADHVELKSDVKNLWRYVAILITFIVLASSLYIHLDSKIAKMNETIASETKYIFNNFKSLENRVANDYRAMNMRLDNVLIHSKKFEKTQRKTQTNTSNIAPHIESSEEH